MSSEPILDSHIHLWPQSAATPDGHRWMRDCPQLARQFSIEDYLSACSDANVRGFVYVETDRALGTEHELAKWAAQPFEELKYLQRIVEGEPREGEGHIPEHSNLLRGIIAWAPIDRGLSGFEEYVTEAQQVAGPLTWSKVKGFRYLLQGIKVKDKFTNLALGDETVEILKSFKTQGRDFVFDVGVDQRQGGIWQLEAAAEMIQRVHEGVGEEQKVTFILNHLCKPDMENIPEHAEEKDAFFRYLACMERFSKQSKVYMKLSGAFSELGDQERTSPWPKEQVVAQMRPWLDVLFRFFPPERIMFGSDWPVCNVRGPGDQLSWKCWRDVVELVLDEYAISGEGKVSIWRGTAIEAYGLDAL